MIITNKIHNTFGPISFAGKLVFIFGCGSVWFSPYAVFLIFGGAFIGFTYLCTSIDTERREVRSGDVLFGLFRTGFWLSVKPNMAVGLVKSEKVWRTYSWSNRLLETEEKNYLITLFNAQGKKLFPLKKITNINSADEELNELGDLLNLKQIKQ